MKFPERDSGGGKIPGIKKNKSQSIYFVCPIRFLSSFVFICFIVVFLISSLLLWHMFEQWNEVKKKKFVFLSHHHRWACPIACTSSEFLFYFLTSIFLYSNENSIVRSLVKRLKEKKKQNKNKMLVMMMTGKKEGAVVGRREQFGSHFTSDISNLPTVSSSIPPPPVISFFFFFFF